MFSGTLKKLLACTVVLACLPAVAQAISVSSYSTVFYPGSTFTLVKGINAYGEAVGEYWTKVNGVTHFHGFYFDGSNYHTADRPSGQWTEAWGINDDGAIVAGGNDSAGHYSGFHTTTALSSFNTIDFTGSNFSELFDINNSNVMVGGYGDGTYHPFIYDLSQDMYTWLDASGSLPNVKTLGAYSINNSNQVAGSYTDNNGNVHGYYFDGSAYTAINGPGAILTEALGINDNGQIVGYYRDSNNKGHGYIYDTLNAKLTTLDILSYGTRIYGINNAGQIAGGYYDAQNSTQYGFIASGFIARVGVVPLPPALLLFGSGLAGLFGVTRFRRRPAIHT
jgi:probable HAF family extracellular repeat protein